MNPEPFFNASFLVVAPFWFLMLILPFWKWTERIIKSPLIILIPSLMYVILIISMSSMSSMSDADGLQATFEQPTIESISALLSDPMGVTVGWLHYLAFDLFVGRWAYLDSRKNNIFWPLVSLTLLFVFMLGPLGFVAYLIVRTVVMIGRKKPLRELIIG